MTRIECEDVLRLNVFSFWLQVVQWPFWDFQFGAQWVGHGFGCGALNETGTTAGVLHITVHVK